MQASLDRFRILMCLSVAGDRDQAIVSDPFILLFVTLPGLDDTKQPAPYHTAREDGCVHKHEDIQWIAVWTDGGRYESKS